MAEFAVFTLHFVAPYGPGMAHNRLAREKSPYLRQHCENPVNWYPWGEEAFAHAKERNKPIFLSIGYAACHWCHVMAHESFENEAIAALMNELFINIKVDREELPDVDSVYMNALQVMGRGGGWPLSAFCLPDGRPFFLGTYFPPEEGRGQPAFPVILRAMSVAYGEDKEKVLENADALMEGLERMDAHFRQANEGSEVALSKDQLITSGRALVQKSDPQEGGLGSKPKFPNSSAHELLARVSRLAFGQPAGDAFLLQAKKMCMGGIYDHVGGGFARYAVDEMWIVPHFEKMLYDNGQLLGICADAFSMTSDPLYTDVIQETISWLKREMQDGSNGLYASQDADSEGVEGKYYVWRPEEIIDALGPADAILFNRYYGVRVGGNFEEGTTVLSRVIERGSDSDEKAIRAMKGRLFERREERVRPDTDTKILSGWNALCARGLLKAWAATGNQEAYDLALSIGAFLRDAMIHGKGFRLSRVYHDGECALDGTLDDYAYAANMFFDLAEATEEEEWWFAGEKLLQSILERFSAEVDGAFVFYLTASDGSDLLIHRPESHHDAATPAGSSGAVMALVRMALVREDEKARQIAERYFRERITGVDEIAFSNASLLAALDTYLHEGAVVLSQGAGRLHLAETVRRAYTPTVSMVAAFGTASLVEGKKANEQGEAQAYVCHGQSCSAPTADPKHLLTLLRGE